jgi:hypothetical protein
MDGVLYIAKPKGEALRLSDGNPLLFRKELIYTGAFVKKNGKAEQHFDVDLPLMLHWQQTFDRMRSDGVTVPIPKEHTADPDARRGELVRLHVGKNADGIDALFGDVLFDSPEAVAKSKNCDVSIFVPPEYTLGRKDSAGNVVTYDRPIRHVAITDYPVIPKLGKFETIAASFVDAKEPRKMDMKKLAATLKIDVAGMDDTAIEAAINTTIEKMVADLATLSASNKPAEKPPAKPAEKPRTISASLVEVVAGSRETSLNALVAERRITTAVADKLKAEYCNREALTLSLSADEATEDGFATILGALKLNAPNGSGAEKTGPQVLELSASQLNSVVENPLLADADARAKAAK